MLSAQTLSLYTSSISQLLVPRCGRSRPCPNLAQHLELRPSKDQGPFRTLLFTFEKSLEGSNGLFARLSCQTKGKVLTIINKFKEQATKKYEYHFIKIYS